MTNPLTNHAENLVSDEFLDVLLDLYEIELVREADVRDLVVA
jgi:hypothetical protein